MTTHNTTTDESTFVKTDFVTFNSMICSVHGKVKQTHQNDTVAFIQSGHMVGCYDKLMNYGMIKPVCSKTTTEQDSTDILAELNLKLRTFQYSCGVVFILGLIGLILTSK